MTDMKLHGATVLIAAPAGSLRTALKSLLASVPVTGSILLAAEPASILAACSSSDPRVILLAGMESHLENISIADLRTAAPLACIICLLDDLQAAPREALSADIVLQQGSPAKTLVAAVERCLEVKSH
jgi:hypothetical protein